MINPDDRNVTAMTGLLAACAAAVAAVYGAGLPQAIATGAAVAAVFNALLFVAGRIR